MTKKGAKDMRAQFAKTALVVDEGSLASTVQARNLLRIADALRIPRVVLVGDAKQLDAVDAGKPFAQLQKAGMQTAVMDEIMRQRDPALKEAVEASLAGDVARAFEKLGSNIEAVKPDNLAGAAAARWLALSPEQRANAGLMAPSHGLRERINEIVRERLVRDGTVHGPATTVERLVSRGYTNAEKTLAANYMPGDTVPAALPCCAGGCIRRFSSSITAAWRSIVLRASAAFRSSFPRSRSLSARSVRASCCIRRRVVSISPSRASERRVQTFSAASGATMPASMPPAGAGALPPPMPSQAATAISTTVAMTENSSSWRRRTAWASSSGLAGRFSVRALTAALP